MNEIPVLPETTVASVITGVLPELVTIRRDIHAHPELSREETRTTALLRGRLDRAGTRVTPMPRTGLVADIGAREPRLRIGLRADIDALPVQERTGLDWASTVDGVCHACGHDVHTTALLGAALVLAELEDVLIDAGVAVRCLFQPAEEVMPGGAHEVVEAGHMGGVDRVFALHCDPGLDVGSIGLREGPITAASDLVEVRLTGRGGHTSRPHLTEDLTFALAKIMTEVPAALSRRLDPRSGVALVWGVVEAGVAPNVIPAHGRALGTLRVLDQSVWEGIEPLLREIVTAQSAPYGVRVDLRHTRGVPPVVNDVTAIADLGRAALAAGLTPVPTAQSLGGEDFSWLLAQAPGAMARLGTRAPGGRTFDLHQGDLVVDERALPNAVGLLVHLALGAARDARQPASR